MAVFLEETEAEERRNVEGSPQESNRWVCHEDIGQKLKQYKLTMTSVMGNNTQSRIWGSRYNETLTISDECHACQ